MPVLFESIINLLSRIKMLHMENMESVRWSISAWPDDGQHRVSETMFRREYHMWTVIIFSLILMVEMG